jgi:hypothetical protein
MMVDIQCFNIDIKVLPLDNIIAVSFNVALVLSPIYGCLYLLLLGTSAYFNARGTDSVPRPDGFMKPRLLLARKQQEVVTGSVCSIRIAPNNHHV